jgi:hypothetical protein
MWPLLQLYRGTTDAYRSVACIDCRRAKRKCPAANRTVHGGMSGKLRGTEKLGLIYTKEMGWERVDFELLSNKKGRKVSGDREGQEQEQEIGDGSDTVQGAKDRGFDGSETPIPRTIRNPTSNARETGPKHNLLAWRSQRSPPSLSQDHPARPEITTQTHGYHSSPDLKHLSTNQLQAFSTSLRNMTRLVEKEIHSRVNDDVQREVSGRLRTMTIGAPVSTTRYDNGLHGRTAK